MKYGELTLGQIEALVNKLGGKDVVKGILSGESRVVVTNVAATLLKFIGTVQIAATGEFFARDHFVINNKSVKFVYIDDVFKQLFLDQVEEPQEMVAIQANQLEWDSLDVTILRELGDKAETTLSKIWELLKKQPNGEYGRLLTNGFANIFYVRDARGTTRVVNVSWRSENEFGFLSKASGWRINAYSTGYLDDWGKGSQVFSRNS